MIGILFLFSCFAYFIGGMFILKGAKDRPRVIFGILILGFSTLILGIFCGLTVIATNQITPTITYVDTLSRVYSTDTITVIQYTLSN